MATVRDVVTDALIEIGVLAAGEAASSGDADLCFRHFNRMVSMHAAEGLLSYTRTRTTWTISQTASYTVGSGGTINIVRPGLEDIEDVRLIDTNATPDTETPLARLTEQAYREIPQKALTSTRPDSWYYNPTMSTGTLYLFPIPTDSGLGGAIYTKTEVAQFASLSTDISLPDGYQEMYVSNLAVRIAPSFQREVSGALAQAASRSKDIVKRSNVRVPYASFPAEALIGGGSRWDIRTDR